MTTNGYPAHVNADFVTSLTTFMYEFQGSLFTSQNNVLRTRHNGDDDGSPVLTRPRTTTIILCEIRLLVARSSGTERTAFTDYYDSL